LILLRIINVNYIFFFNYPAPSFYKVNRKIWLTIFYSIYRLIVSGVERTCPWDLIPTTKQFALYLLTHD